MFKQIRRDIQSVFDRDPAAHSVLEVMLSYAGLHAIWWYRVAHWFHKHGLFVTARVLSQLGRHYTGVEIHPGAKIGDGLFIDHGMGVIIGETAEIGDNVTLFQGVTLGGTGKECGKRHPTIGNNVLVGAGAKVLGSFTVGDNSLVGSNAVVLKPLEPGSTAVGVPAEVVRLHGEVPPFQHDKLPDPIKEHFEMLEERIAELEKRLEK